MIRINYLDEIENELLKEIDTKVPMTPMTPKCYPRLLEIVQGKRKTSGFFSRT